MANYKGNDVSYCQEGIPMQALRENGTSAVVIRAGLATSKDVTMDGHIKNAVKAGIPYGFYWYSYAENSSEAYDEAIACINTIKAYNPALPVFYDVERERQIRLDKKTLTDIYVVFCEKINEAGFTPGIYINPSFWNACDNTQLKGYEIWLAHWVSESSYISKTGAKMWQWGTENIAGYKVDADILYKKYWDDDRHISAPPKTESINRGDKVTVNLGAVFVGGIKPFTFVYHTTFEVLRISKDCTEALIGLDGCATGWMHIKDLTKAKPTPAEVTVSVSLKVGDKVRVKDGTPTYDGTPLASFVYKGIYDVMQVGTKTYPDYIVIGQGGIITAAVKAENLIKS